VTWGAWNRVCTRNSQLVAVLGVSVMAEFVCWPAGALGDSALSTRSAVLVATSPGYSTLSPPTVMRTRCGSALCGLYAQTNLTYVGICPFGIALW
jgi:hypothetical protein